MSLILAILSSKNVHPSWYEFVFNMNPITVELYGEDDIRYTCM